MSSKIMALVLKSGVLLTGYSINNISNSTKTVIDVSHIEQEDIQLNIMRAHSFTFITKPYIDRQRPKDEKND